MRVIFSGRRKGIALALTLVVLLVGEPWLPLPLP